MTIDFELDINQKLMTRSICDSTVKSTDCFRSSLYKKEHGNVNLKQADIGFTIVEKKCSTLLPKQIK